MRDLMNEWLVNAMGSEVRQVWVQALPRFPSFPVSLSRWLLFESHLLISNAEPLGIAPPS